MNTLKPVQNFDDLRVLQTMLGVPQEMQDREDGGLPESVIRCYREYRAFYDRVSPGSSLSTSVLALICVRADAVAQAVKHEWLYKGWRLKTIGPGSPIQVAKSGAWLTGTLLDWNEESRIVRVDLGNERVIDVNVNDVQQVLAPPTFEPNNRPEPKGKK